MRSATYFIPPQTKPQSIRRFDVMKIELVFIPSPGVGHIRSTTALAKRLVDSDDRLSITLIVIPSQFSNVASSSAYTESKDRLRYIFLSAGDQSIKHTFISYIESWKPHVRAAMSELVREVSTRSNSPRLAGIVVDMFCTSMIDVADEFSLPAYIFYTSNATYLGLQFHVQSLYNEKKLDVNELKESDVKFDVPLLTQPFPANCLPSVMLDKQWFPYILGRVKRMRASKGILVNAVAEMEPQALQFFSGGNSYTPPVYPVGPILDFETDGDREEKDDILRWLDEQPSKSVVFLCFGSMGGFDEEQTREIAVALERSGYRFLWSLRRASLEENMTGSPSPPGEFANLEMILPEGFLNRTVNIGKIISWAPQVAVLESSAIGAFVTHCGWNSILESLWFGVPMAAWPIYAEQQFNAFHMVEELGLAAEIKKEYRRGFKVGESEIVTAEEIENGIKCAMKQDSEMRKKVMEMRDKLHVALLNGGSSNGAMRKFVQDVIDNVPY